MLRRGRQAPSAADECASSLAGCQRWGRSSCQQGSKALCQSATKMLQSSPRAGFSREDWSAQSCPRLSCSLFGEAARGNIRPRGWIGRRRDIRLLSCKVCGSRFSERSRTALQRSKLTPRLFASIAEHLAEGCGLRSTSRLCGVAVTTVLRVLVRVGTQARRLHDLKVRELAIVAMQPDEKRCHQRPQIRVLSESGSQTLRS